MPEVCRVGFGRLRRAVTGMPSRVKVQLAVYCILFLVITAACAETITSSELIDSARQYDGQTITYAGEVIGDIMVRGGFAWINVKDDKGAIGVWVDRELIEDITHTGGYKSRGDWIEVVGVFHRACLEHGGDLDIHAQALRRVKEGEEIKTDLNLYKRNAVLVLLGALCLVLILRQLKIK